LSILGDVPESLLDDIVNNKCIPIIGAGFSRNAELPRGFKMPLWNDLADEFARKMKGYPYVNALDSISAYSQDNGRSKTIEELRRLLHVGIAKPGKAHLTFANLPFDIIVTTNFDSLLEDAFNIQGKPIFPVLEEDSLSITNFGNPYGRNRVTVLLKIHGDLNHPNQLIMTEEDYDTFMIEKPLICTYLASLLIVRTPLFIGYSLEDPDFRGIWQVIGNRLKKLRRQAYAISLRKNKTEEDRFDRRGVKVITLGD
jgi:hypothetical protein